MMLAKIIIIPPGGHPHLDLTPLDFILIGSAMFTGMAIAAWIQIYFSNK